METLEELEVNQTVNAVVEIVKENYLASLSVSFFFWLYSA